MKKWLQFTLLLTILFTSQKVNATHMMGSDIRWDCIGKDSFVITLVVYRDCNGINLGDAIIPIKCTSTGTLLTTLTIPLPMGVDVTPTCGTSCTRCISKACAFPYGIQQYSFRKLVYLGNNIPANCCELKLSYSRCCRNSSITTGAANQNFYTEAILNRCVSPFDNSPRFTNPPIAIICKEMDFVFCHGIVYPDVDPNSGGLIDSLSYEWTEPLSVAGKPIAYRTPFSYNKPISFWGFPDDTLSLKKGLHMDNCTISFRPMKTEQTIMAILIKEWRYDSSLGKRVVIGQIRREMQIIVIECPKNRSPVLNSPYYYKDVYEDNTVDFSISTNDSDTNDSLEISWSNNLAGAKWSYDKGVKHPTAKLSWKPPVGSAQEIPYVFTVTVKDDECPVRGITTKAFKIRVIDPTSIEESKKDDNFILVSNLLGGAIQVSGKDPNQIIRNIVLYDINGRLVFKSENINENQYAFTPRVFTGVYLIKIKLLSGKSIVKKILIE